MRSDDKVCCEARLNGLTRSLPACHPHQRPAPRPGTPSGLESTLDLVQYRKLHSRGFRAITIVPVNFRLGTANFKFYSWTTSQPWRNA